MKKRVEQIIEQNQRQNSQIAGALAGALSQALTPPPLPPLPARKAAKGKRQAAQQQENDGNLPLRLTPYGDGLAENGFSDPISGKIWVTNKYS